jgi:hypothetical protein
MRIITSQTPPPIWELAKILKQEFAGHYSYKLFGLGKKSLIVGRSRFVGAQITINGHEISIQATPPSPFAGMLLSLGYTPLGIVLIPLFLLDGCPLPFGVGDLEKEIGLFLKHKYA